MFEDAFQGLWVLTLRDGSIGLEDIFDRGVHIGFEGQIDEFILDDNINTANF